MKMNIYVIFGVVIIAIGTCFLYLGSSKSDKIAQKEVTEKIEETQRKIEELKHSGSGNVDTNKINEIENEFNAWADSFLQNKEILKLSFQKKDINDKEERLSLNAKWRPFYVSFFINIKNIIDAYNKKSNDVVKYKIVQLPENLFNPDNGIYTSSISFRENIQWEFKLTPPSALEEAREIGWIVRISDPTKNISYDKFSFTLIDGNFLLVKHFNERFNMKQMKKKYPINDNTSHEIAKDLMESQLLQL